MESLRRDILVYIEQKIKSRKSITKKNPVIVTVKEVCEHYPHKHPPSISRDFREMRKVGLIPSIQVGDKYKGIWKLILPSGEKSSKPAFVKMITLCRAELEKSLKRTKNDFIGPLTEALEKKNDRTLSEASKSQENHSK
jgi:hypothetical protein